MSILTQKRYYYLMMLVERFEKQNFLNLMARM